MALSCKRIVGILSLAARADCEQPLGAYLQQQIAKDRLPCLHQLEQRFDPNARRALSDGLEEGCVQHALSAYDALMPTSMEVH